MIPTPDTGGNRLRLEPREYAIYGGLGLLLIGLIVLYILEFDHFNRTFEPGRMLGASAIVGALLGALLAYRLSRGAKEMIERVQIYVFCIALCAIFAPLLGSLSNRLLSFQPAREEPFIFFQQKPFAEKPFGVLQGEEVKADGYYLFFFREGKLERIKVKEPLSGSPRQGDTIYLPVRRGLWGVEWVAEQP